MHPIIEIKTIMYMRAIAREGSFQSAAEALYTSQPALSQYIKRVEDELTFPLYERDRGRCIPTAAGTVLLEHGKALLENYESMLEEMKTAANVKDVRIGWPTGYTLLYFTKLFSYMENNFLVNAHILEDSVEVLLSALLKKDIDLLFIPAIYAHPSMEYVTVRHEEFYLGVPKKHEINALLAQTQRDDGFVDLCHVKGLPFLLIDAKAYTVFFYDLFRYFDWMPNVIFVCKNWDRGFNLVAQGECLAILPYWYADRNNENVIFYRIKNKRSTYRIFACAYRKNAIISNPMQAVINYMMEHAGDEYAGTPIDQETLPLHFRF